MHPRQSEWSDLEWQLRNWLYFPWLSGDHIVEQAVHRIDILNWVMRSCPTNAYGMGGRQVRTDPAYGNIYDHFAVEYEYPNGARVEFMCRQIDGTDARITQQIVGTKGVAGADGRVDQGRESVQVERAAEQRVCGGMEGSDRINSKWKAAERRAANRRKYVDGGDGSYVGVHRQKCHMGTGDAIDVGPLAEGNAGLEYEACGAAGADAG